MHRIGSMTAAACTGDIMIAIKGTAMPAAPPPIPPLEIPWSTTAGMATTQNHGLVMISKLTRFVSLLLSRRHSRSLSHNSRLRLSLKKRRDRGTRQSLVTIDPPRFGDLILVI